MGYTPSNILVSPIIQVVSSEKKLEEKGVRDRFKLKIFFEFCYDFNQARKKKRLRVVPLPFL